MSSNEETNRRFGEHDAGVSERAMQAFRRRRQFGRVLAATPVVLAAGVLMMAWFFPVGDDSRRSGAAVDLPAEPRAKEQTEQARYLTDKELLGLFPAGSCFFAEVNGTKVLVFDDPAVKKRFFN